MPKRSSSLVVAFLVAMSVGRSAVAQDLYITNARVLDVCARTESARHVLIHAGVIVGFPPSPPRDYTGSVFDAGGRWVMPALSDMHTHSVGNFLPPGGFQMMGPEGVARAALYAGVARSPVAEMRNTERLHAVIHRGVVVDRNAIRPVAP